MQGAAHFFFDPGMKRFATEAQWRVWVVRNESESNCEAGEKLGISERSVRRALKAVEAQAAARGYSPRHGWNYPGLGTPDPFVIERMTDEVEFAEDGREHHKRRWYKLAPERERLKESLQVYAEGLAQGVAGGFKPTTEAPGSDYDPDLLTVIPWGDPHIGLYSWAKETGQNFNTKIARDNMITAARRLAELCPPTERCVIINLGDFFESDNMENRTKRSGNALDVDGRYYAVLEIGRDTQIACIEAALERHRYVELYTIPGNHDDHSSIAIQMILASWFKDEPRVTIHPNPKLTQCLTFGNTMIGLHHGHEYKLSEMGSVMASEFPQEWGAARHRYGWQGHVHEHRVHPGRGWKGETWPTLAARNAWAAGKGYKSERDMQAVIIGKTGGDRGRIRVDIEEIEALQSPE